MSIKSSDYINKVVNAELGSHVKNNNEDADKSELYYEAAESLEELNYNVDKDKNKNSHKDETEKIRIDKITNLNKLNLNNNLNIKQIPNKLHSAYASGVTDVTNNKHKTLHSVTNLDKIKTNNSNSIEELKSQNSSNNGLNKHPRSMNINGNLKSSARISLNLNVNINFNKDNIEQCTETVKKVINLVKLDAEKNNESIYETARYDLDDDDDNYHNQFSKLNNFKTLPNELLDDEEVEPENLTSLDQMRKKITEIKFDMVSDIDLGFFIKNMRLVHVKNKQVSPHNRHFRYLLELQNFTIDFQQIWTVKISNDSKYIATGGKSGVLRIFEILNFITQNFQETYTTRDVMSYLQLINEKPFRIYQEHSNDIIDICWSTKNNNILLTASLDHLVIMWDIKYEYPLSKFTHSSIVTCICFYSQDKNEDEKFVSGCLDKIIRIWSLKKNKVLDYINIKEYITAISYLPTGDMFVVGTHNGRCSIYDCKPKLRYNFSFTCRNRMGKYAYGRKITNIEFVNRTQALITTNDSRIRLVNISDGKLVQKYKGHVNEDYMIKSFSEDDLVISASEEGSVLVWSLKNKENKAKKNYSYEFFRPFKQDTSACSFLVNDETLADYLKKLFNLTTKVMVYSICLNASISGSLQVLLNCDSIENITF